MGDFAPVLNHARPVCDKRCRDATLVIPPLEFAKRRIAEIGPGQIYRTVRRRRTGRNIGGAGPVFIAGAVVGQKQHEGVFLYTEFAEFGLQAPDILVHAVDHGRVNSHLQIPGISILNLLPRQRIRIARREGPPLVNQAHLDHAFEALLPQPVPTDFVFALILCDVPRPGVQGIVRRSIGHVEKERSIFPPVLVQVSKGVIGERISSVEFFVLGCIGLDDPVVDGKCGIVVRKFFTGLFFTGSLQTRVKEVTAPIDEAVIAVETPFDG